MRLQSIYGLFPRIIGKGDGAKVCRIQIAKISYLKINTIAIGRHVITYEKRTIGDR
jgi:hypothetical protein